jgi:hypothetical protein
MPAMIAGSAGRAYSMSRASARTVPTRATGASEATGDEAVADKPVPFGRGAERPRANRTVVRESNWTRRCRVGRGDPAKEWQAVPAQDGVGCYPVNPWARSAGRAAPSTAIQRA